MQDTDVRLIGFSPLPIRYLIPQQANALLTPNITANLPLLPLRTRTRGPAYTLPALPPSTPAHESPDPDSESYDALDEILSLYRANTFFRNFEIKGPADRLLIYGILTVGELLGKVPKMGGAREGEKVRLLTREGSVAKQVEGVCREGRGVGFAGSGCSCECGRGGPKVLIGSMHITGVDECSSRPIRYTR